MSALTALQVLDKFLAPYHIGHATVLLFLLTLPAGIVKKSVQIIALTLIAFGGVFFVIPSISDAGSVYSFVGLALMVIGPMAYTTATR